MLRFAQHDSVAYACVTYFGYATLLRPANYSDNIFSSGAVLSAENAGEDTGATDEVVTIICSLQ